MLMKLYFQSSVTDCIGAEDPDSEPYTLVRFPNDGPEGDEQLKDFCSTDLRLWQYWPSQSVELSDSKTKPIKTSFAGLGSLKL